MKVTQQGVPTSLKPQREGLVRTWKESDRARHSHSLETTEGGICQDMEQTNRARCTHFLEITERGTCQDRRKQQSKVD